MEPKTHILNREIALVTGGGSGLGLAIAHALARAGARVAVAGRRLEPLQAAVREMGPEVCLVQGDVGNPVDRLRLLAESENKLGGPVSILVNNAGQNFKKPALDLTDEEFAALLDTHLTAGFALAREAARSMLKRRHGSILFIASMASYMGVPGVAGYSAAKAGVLGLVRALAAEWSSGGVRVNAIAPGWIDTEMSRKAFAGDPERRQKVLSRTPMARTGQPSEIGEVAAWLCSPAAGFITGQTLPVDGGASIGF